MPARASTNSTTLLPIGDLEDPIETDGPIDAREPVAVPVVADTPERVPAGGLRGRLDELTTRIASAGPLAGPLAGPPTTGPTAGRRPGERQQIADRIAGRARRVYGLTNTLAAPLTSEVGVIGAIVLSHRRAGAWSPTTRRILNGAAVEASSALSRAYSHRAAETQASTDALTGLPNRRYFDEFCGLLARRRRSGDAVGVLMIDIDRFKILNDDHGHATGDEVLRAVGGAIIAAVREDDVPARYGGEEFVVLLRNPTPDVAYEVGERVRASVGALDLRRIGVASVSVSVGVAVARQRGPAHRRPDRRRGPGALSGQARGPQPGRGGLSRSRAEPTDYHRTVTDDPPELTNGDLARIFHEIGDMLELKGELVFKTVAYHRAADAIGRSPADIVSAYRAGTPPHIPGVGKAISDKIGELATTGQLAFYDRLRAEIPPSLVELLRIPGLGPKTVRQLNADLGIETVDDLRSAAESGRIRGLRGMSARTEGLILEGIAKLDERFDRMRLDRAEELVEALIGALGGMPGVDSIEPAGSFRRRKESIGDLDLLAETSAAGALMDAFTGFALVDSVVNRGGYKAAVRLQRGPQVDLMVMPPGEAGTYRIHFTGSKEHNVRLRAMARDRGWSLSEKGFLRIGDDGEPLTGPAAELRTFPTEAEAYDFLGLPYITPELREDAGEIEAALAGRLPALVELADLRGDLHSHSDWSDGHHPIEVMAEHARRRGYAYQVLTDHSQSLAIARGLTPDRVAEQADIVARLNAGFAAEEATGTAPPDARPEGFRLLHGCELEIRADGTLDFEDDLLARFDLVVASVHVARRQSRDELTQRTLNAIRSPHVDVIAHPSGRKIGERDDLDLDWEAVYAEAARTGTALEMNGSPPRLDLAVERARRAVSIGCLLSIDSDAHDIKELDYVRWGISQARRAWVTPDVVLNTRSRADLLAWTAGKVRRV